MLGAVPNAFAAPNCMPCLDGFSLTKTCCNGADKSDCITLSDDIETCGIGQWEAYPYTSSQSASECCTDSSETNCRFSRGVSEPCGSGSFINYPYAPIKKCCKDTNEEDCVIIRSRTRCGEYQLKDYPFNTEDCCNSSGCIGYTIACPQKGCAISPLNKITRKNTRKRRKYNFIK